ncbi:MAG: membrane protein insertase YidC, partial [Caulobacteraceae bacterium]
MPTEHRNLVAFVIVAGLILLAYQMFIVGPQAKRLAAEHAAAQAHAPVAAAVQRGPTAMPLARALA